MQIITPSNNLKPRNEKLLPIKKETAKKHKKSDAKISRRKKIIGISNERSLNEIKLVLDENLNITRRVIQPLNFVNLPKDIKKLLIKRNCTSFPCSQKVEDEDSLFKTRRKMYKEGCKVSSGLLKVKRRWSHLMDKYPRSNNFHLCKIPKVSI